MQRKNKVNDLNTYFKNILFIYFSFLPVSFFYSFRYACPNYIPEIIIIQGKRREKGISLFSPTNNIQRYFIYMYFFFSSARNLVGRHARVLLVFFWGRLALPGFPVASTPSGGVSGRVGGIRAAGTRRRRSAGGRPA